ncbi:beta-lactamase-like protein, partial [Entophlyctis helioformis]
MRREVDSGHVGRHVTGHVGKSDALWLHLQRRCFARRLRQRAPREGPPVPPSGCAGCRRPTCVSAAARVSACASACLRVSAAARPPLTLPAKAPAVTSLTRSVARITSPPAGPYSTQDCHAYLIGTGPDRILIDTGTGHTDFIDTLVLHLRAQNAKLSTVLLTHSHGNHASGLIRIFQRYNHTTFTVSKVKSPGSDKAGLDKIKFIKDGDIVSTLDGSVRLRTVHTPGHAADHACFWLDSDGILFSGDAILSRPPLPGTPLQPPSAHAIFESLPDYLASLTKLERLVPSLIFPAHGDIVVATLDSLQQARLAQLRLSQSIVDIIACHPARVVST